METIRALILRLQQQSDQQINNSELLVTVQALEAALQKALAEPVKPVRMGNISVVLPAGNRLHSAPAPAAVEPEKEREMAGSAKQLPEIKPAFEAVPEIAKAFEPELQTEDFLKPITESTPAVESKPAIDLDDNSRYAPKPAAEIRPSSLTKPAPDNIYAETKPSYETRQVFEPVAGHKPVEPVTVAENFHLSFAKEDEAKKHSTSQQMEMNDIFSQSSSLNDRLKGDQQEIGSVLNEEPVKDLRRAIGINDRFVYLNELFRGDEVMYERSLKTINNFRIYPEAEYWIERELKVKMGWDESKETVKQFRQLVRRRFQV